MVFLGEDLMHSRDYSDETARVIDEEVERILREQEDKARATLREHRGGLDLVARALLEKETIDGEEVGRLVDQAAGRVVRRKTLRPLAAEPAADGDGAARARPANGSSGQGDGTEDGAAEVARGRRAR